MKSTPTIRLYRPGDEEGIVELLQRVFTGWPDLDLECSPVHHWLWMHVDNPVGKSIVVLAISSDKIIGCNHTQFQNFNIGKKTYLTGVGVNEAVHPDFRGMGLWKAMAELKEQEEHRLGIEFKLGATANPLIIGHHLRGKMRTRFPYNLINLIRMRDVGLHLRMMSGKRSRFKKYWFQTEKIYNNLNFFKRYGQSYDSLKITEIKNFESINELLNIISPHYNFMKSRSLEYLNWRYFDPRAGEFKVKKIEENGENIGYIVLRFNRYIKDYPVGYIAEMLTIPDRFDAIDAMIRDSIKYFDDQKVNAIKCAVIDRHPYMKILRNNGFINLRQKLFFSFEPYVDMTEDIQRLQNSAPNQITYMHGDYNAI